EEREIGRLRLSWRKQVYGHAVMHSANPSGLRQGAPLGVGNRNHGNVREGMENRLMLGQVETAVQSRNEWRRLPREQRERVVVEVKVQDVEVQRASTDKFEHRSVKRKRIADRPIVPQCARPDRL